MLTITIEKEELKKAFSGKDAVYSQELTVDGEIIVNLDVTLLKIILDSNIPISNPEEAT